MNYDLVDKIRLSFHFSTLFICTVYITFNNSLNYFYAAMSIHVRKSSSKSSDMTKIYFILLYKTLAKCTNPVRLLSLKYILWKLYGFWIQSQYQYIMSSVLHYYRTVTVKPSQAYPPRFYQWIDYLKNESVSHSRNWCQIQSGISACVMSSEYFTRTSLYLVRLEICECIKLLRRHLHQFQENGAGRNFITASHVNSRLITHTRMQTSIWNLQLSMDSTFE